MLIYSSFICILSSLLLNCLLSLLYLKLHNLFVQTLLYVISLHFPVVLQELHTICLKLCL